MNGSTRSWPANGVAPSPFHRGQRSPLRDIVPLADDGSAIKIDLAHAYAIAGFGKDHLASVIVFVAVRCRFWGGTNIPDQLDLAFASFSRWCATNKRYTTIKTFDFTELKITSLLDLHQYGITEVVELLTSFGFRKMRCQEFKNPLFHSPPFHAKRLQHYPRGLGKGSDAAVVGSWLEAVLNEMGDTVTVS